MGDKIFKSTWTWRKLDDQEAALKDAVLDFAAAPRFIDDERESLLRPTRRAESDRIHVASISCFAKDEDDLREALTLLDKRKAFLHCEEENYIRHPGAPIANTVKLFKQSRINGSAMIGGRRSAESRKAKVKAGCDKIKDRWPLPSGTWPTRILLAEADCSLNSAKSILGNRPIAQRNFRAEQKRKERRDAKRAN